MEPRIEEIGQSITFLGLEISTSNTKAFSDIPRLGKQFQQLKKQVGIPHQKDPWKFVAVSKDYNKENGSFIYQMGNVVSQLKDVPEPFEAYEVPAGKYAVFIIAPRFKFLWGRAILKMKKYVYSKWLPQSEYESAGTIDEFELHDERSLGRKPSIDLYVAIKDKK